MSQEILNHFEREREKRKREGVREREVVKEKVTCISRKVSPCSLDHARYSRLKKTILLKNYYFIQKSLFY